MGAALLLSGLVAAIATAPLFDRVFTHHLALTSKFLVPIIAGAWLSLIWAVKPHNTGALFAIMAIIGACSLTMLPIGLELGCEVTRNSDGSSALLWFLCVFLRKLFVNSFANLVGMIRCAWSAEIYSELCLCWSKGHSVHHRHLLHLSI